MPTLTTCVQYYAESPRDCNKARKINKWHTHRKKRCKTVSTCRSQIVHMENPNQTGCIEMSKDMGVQEVLTKPG